MFQERLNKLLKDNNMFQTDLSKYVGYSSQAVSKWCRGDSEPDLNSLIKIANFFNVTTDYLLGIDSKENKSNTNLKDLEKEALRKTLVNAGYMKNNEDLSNEELKNLIKFVKNNKEFIKGVK